MVIADRPVARSWVSATIDALRAGGWIEGQNLTVDVRFGASDPERIRRATEELLGLEPDVVLAQGVVGAGVLQRATKTVPVVFVQVQDPVGGGFVTSLSRPEANLTGFTNFDYAMVGKWMALLKEVAPDLTRVLAIINPGDRTRWNGYAGALEQFASALGLGAQMAGVRDPGEIERALASFGAEPHGGLVVLPDATTGDHAGVIIAEAARHRLPAVYPYENQAQQGGLITYTSGVPDQYRAAAAYIDRLLRGAKPGDLPVQAAERFVTILNLRTAAALGLQIPPTLLATVDEVIE
ncbi:MAG TPA: ABC transporter substrate-binding protein [Beijerinckiaceae bacterium]|nr:ABC transporter substrate-binding protein [Beijerinckiaceae bacterium]